MFEITENPSIENTSRIENEGKNLVKAPTKINKRNNILKIKLNGVAYYHFSNCEFDPELATRKESAKIGGKTFYLGLKDLRIHSKLNLVNKE